MVGLGRQTPRHPGETGQSSMRIDLGDSLGANQSAAVMVKRNGCRITQPHRHVNVSRRLRRVAGTWPPSVAWHSAISWLKPYLWRGEDQSRRLRLKFDWRRGKAPTSHPGERPRSHQQIARGTPRVLDTGTLAFIGDAHLPRHLHAVKDSLTPQRTTTARQASTTSLVCR